MLVVVTRLVWMMLVVVTRLVWMMLVVVTRLVWMILVMVNRLVLVVFFLLADSPASEFFVPTFRNIVFHLHRQYKYYTT